MVVMKINLLNFHVATALEKPDIFFSTEFVMLCMLVMTRAAS